LASAAVVAVIFSGNAGLSRPARAVFGVACLQALLGVLNVLLRLPVEVTLLHTGGAALLALATSWLNHAACHSVRVGVPIRPVEPDLVAEAQ
jgi:heme A synthase